MVNSGSPIASQSVVNVNEFVYQIKEGEIKNYNWDTPTSSWVPYTGEVSLNLSGVVISIASGTPVGVSGQVMYQSVSGGSQSGMVVWGNGLSGAMQTIPTMQQLAWLSGVINAGNSSGILLSGGVVISSTIAASAPSKLQIAELVFVSGIASAAQSGVQLNIIRVAAQGGISATITSAWFTSAFGTLAYIPTTPIFIMSGDIVTVSVRGLSSGNCSGLYYVTRTVLGN